MRKSLMRSGLRVLALVVVGAAVCAGFSARHGVMAGQVQQQPTTPAVGAQPNPLDPGSHGAPGAPDDPYSGRIRRQQQNALLDDRHQRMVADADKLLLMATELKQEVDKSTKNETSVSAYNKADAIEKLAHDVKQRLRN